MTELLEVRKQFEKWCTDVMFCDPEHLERLTGGSYRVHNVQYWWMGWEAALSRSGAPTEPRGRLMLLAARIARRELLPPIEECKTILDARRVSREYDDTHAHFAQEFKAAIDALDSRSAPEIRELCDMHRAMASLCRECRKAEASSANGQEITAKCTDCKKVRTVTRHEWWQCECGGVLYETEASSSAPFPKEKSCE